MGVIRKSLMFGSLGLVRGSSKKQRVAKAQLKELRKQTAIVQAQAQAQVSQTPAAPRPSTFREGLRAGLGTKSVEQPAQLPAAPPEAPAPGWYPSPQQTGQMQWWDGAQWTPSFAPAT
ncbi:DUF2510 domain-containing protein [Amycolatopsis ultiminotia]|uniref:DUF2510 domain-containing protein n=1 Tax=Amycolatopsis ultiminotia TaxID=543629 RepID=A0ABP6X0J6_9PSEU